MCGKMHRSLISQPVTYCDYQLMNNCQSKAQHHGFFTQLLGFHRAFLQSVTFISRLMHSIM